MKNQLLITKTTITTTTTTTTINIFNEITLKKWLYNGMPFLVFPLKFFPLLLPWLPLQLDPWFLIARAMVSIEEETLNPKDLCLSSWIAKEIAVSIGSVTHSDHWWIA